MPKRQRTIPSYFLAFGLFVFLASISLEFGASEVTGMERKMLIDHYLVEQASKRFISGATPLTFVGGLQNRVYEFIHDGTSYILRLTPITNRTESMVQSELDWILFLADHGVSVSKPISSKKGRLTETVYLSDGYFICAVFEKAGGRKIGYPEYLLDNTLYERLGRFTGKLHALSKTYRPPAHIEKRHDWSSNWFLQNIDIIPKSQAGIRASCANLVKTIASLPKDKRSYGLIHGDIGVGNFTVNDLGEITLFDFDEAQYSWFVEDIAIQLYYLVYVYGEDGKELREEQAHRFMHYFMMGYHQENSLDEFWIKQIPLFLRLRELIVYIGAFRNWDGDETFSGSGDEWFKDWIAESKVRIENEIPIVNIWD
jgi:Ser/Thr protein kinase RdoA (MazF antagonist)